MDAFVTRTVMNRPKLTSSATPSTSELTTFSTSDSKLVTVEEIDDALDVWSQKRKHVAKLQEIGKKYCYQCETSKSLKDEFHHGA